MCLETQETKILQTFVLKKHAFTQQGSALECKALGAQEPTCPTADVKEDSVPSSLAELPNCLVQNLCSSRVDLEKGVWRDAELQAEQLFEDVWCSMEELVRGLLVGAACHGAGRSHKKQLLEGSREELVSIPRLLMGREDGSSPQQLVFHVRFSTRLKHFDSL